MRRDPANRLAVLPICVLAVGGLLIPLSAVAQVADATAKASPTPSDDQLWVVGSDRVLSGDFDEARSLLGEILQRDPGNENMQEVAAWLEQWRTQESRRLELEIEQRDLDLERARRNIKKEKYDNALHFVRAAMKSAPQSTEFMREPWIEELHDKAIEAARAHEEKNEWSDASSIYYELHQLYEGNPEYKDLMDRCLAHSRLDVVYKPDNEWERRISGVTRRMAEEALRRVRMNYVTDANFKELTRRAYRRMLILPQSESLVELFPECKDEQKRDGYVRRVEKQLTRIGKFDEGEFTFEDAQRYFKRAISINKQTIDLREELVIYEYIEAGLDSLDQFSTMIWPTDFAEFEKHTQGHFTGVGIQISKQKDILTVVTPLEDTPAFRAGIQAGDQVIEIDGEDATGGLTLNEAVRKITGPPQSTVVLTIRRPSTDETFPVELQRQEIKIKTVKGWRRMDHSDRWDWMIDPDLKISYVRISNFNQETARDLARAIDEIQQQDGRAMILDLRFNPGGLLRSSIEVSDLFLGAKLDVVGTSGPATAREQLHKSTHDARFNKPMVVLVNEQSASASEIVSGALKDHQRAVIMGERTFGKGSVQNLIPVGPSSAHLKLTTAHYYLPSGTLIHKVDGAEVWGVEPDIHVDLTPRESSRVYSMRRDADVIRAEDDGAGDGSADATSAGNAKDDTAADAKAASTTETTVAAVDGGDDDADGTKSDATEKTTAEGDAAEGADGEADAEEEEEPLPILTLPDVDYQLESALLVLRVQLLQDHGFGIMPKVKLGAKTSRDKNLATN